MPDIRILSLGTANPPLRVSQEETYEAYARMLPLSDRAQALLRRIFVDNRSIGYRHFGMDSLDDILRNSQDELIARYRKYAVSTAVDAAHKALARAELGPADIDGIVVNSCTGYLCPGLTSYVSEALSLRPDVHPFDLQGMGCGAALPSLETAYNWLHAHPDRNVLAIAAEMCSATLYFDEAPDILISNALFGDGAAAAVLTNRPGIGCIRLKGFAAGLYPQDRQHLHYRTENSKLRNVLSVEVPAVGGRRATEVIDRLLAAHGLGRADIARWALHPGGQKVIDALQQALDLPDEAVASSRRVLYRYGNMSSASVLFVLEDMICGGGMHAGDLGVLCSFGAGFGAYAGLFEILESPCFESWV
jgi:alkylresorcinol/alkylpyrone synthase